jgi:hypothetical protein
MSGETRDALIAGLRRRGFSYRQIGRAVGMSPTSVGHALHRWLVDDGAAAELPGRSSLAAGRDARRAPALQYVSPLLLSGRFPGAADPSRFMGLRVF